MHYLCLFFIIYGQKHVEIMRNKVVISIINKIEIEQIHLT
jgi:hypothetical protein